MNEQTISFYDANAKSYADSTIGLDMSILHNEFLSNLPAGASILDAGCGSGRDALKFKTLGFDVTAIDASAELVKIAFQNIGQNVIQKSFEEINWNDKFDGVWCMASLLHLNDEELIKALGNIALSLKDDGIIFASFKAGEGSSYDDKGRFFNYHTMEELLEFFETFTGLFTNVKCFYNKDSMGREDTQWISVIAKVNNKAKFLRNIGNAESAFLKHLKSDSIYALFPDSVWEDFENQDENFKFTINMLKTVWTHSWLEKKESAVVIPSEGKGVKVQTEDPQALISFEQFVWKFSTGPESVLQKMNSYEPTNPSYYDSLTDNMWQFWLKAWKTKP